MKTHVAVLLTMAALVAQLILLVSFASAGAWRYFALCIVAAIATCEILFQIAERSDL